MDCNHSESNDMIHVGKRKPDTGSTTHSTRTLKPIVPLQVIVTICARFWTHQFSFSNSATWPGRDVKYIKSRLSPTGYGIRSGVREPKIADSQGKSGHMLTREKHLFEFGLLLFLTRQKLITSHTQDPVSPPNAASE